MRLTLRPKDEPFLPLFRAQSDVLADASRLLVQEAKACGQNADSFATEVLALEHKGDRLIKEILTRLGRSFVSRLEPEDIHLLASRLDDVLDGIEDSAYRIAAYDVSELPHPAVRLCEIIENCSRVISETIQRLAASAFVLKQCAAIHRLESEADAIMRSALAELLEREGDALTVIKLKEIYEYLEGTVDLCEDVADVLQNIAVKNCQ